MAAPQNGPIEITRTVLDVEGMEAPRYEEMTGDELAQTVADLSGMSLHDVITDGVQTSLVALHMNGGVPEDRQDLIRLAHGESFVRPTAFQRVHPDPNAPGVLVLDVPLDSMTGPQRIDAAMGIRSSPANVKSTAAPPMAAIPERTVAATSSSNARSQNAADENAKCPPECTHLMRETLYPHKLSRNGSVNREVSNALSKMDCGAELRKTWNDLDMYVTLEDTAEMTKIETYAKGMAKVLHEAQVKLAEAVFKREWSEECPILSLLMPGTRSGGLSGCRFDHPDERSNGPMSSLRLRMNSLAIGPVTNRPDECMMETGWFAMTKERMFLTKPVWNIRWVLEPNAEQNAVANLVNVYDWVMLPIEIGKEYYQTGEIDLTRFPCHQLNGSFSALSAMRKCVQWFCQDVFPEGSEYSKLCFVVRRRDVNEAKRQWTESTANKRMKLDNYFNRQFTDHISTQNATKVVENDDDTNGKWMWKVPNEASRLSMGLITVDPDDPMDNTYTGPQQMSLSEMTEFSREATLWGMGLIEWRLMGHTMVPVKQGTNDGLDADCSTWDELYADEDENAHPWTVPSAAKTPKNAATTSQGSGATATVLAHVANALNPGAEVVLRKNVNAATAKKFSDWK